MTVRRIKRALAHVRRSARWSWQRRTRGWDNRELWSLDCTLAKWLLPRLREFRDIAPGYPGWASGPEEWREMLDKMVAAFEWMASEERWTEALTPEKVKEIDEGLDLFREHIFDLWY